MSITCTLCVRTTREAIIPSKDYPYEHRLADLLVRGDVSRVAEALLKLQGNEISDLAVRISGLLRNQAQTRFIDVVEQFGNQWKHPTSIPVVVNVWKIDCDPGHIEQFERYKRAMECTSGIPGGNSKRLWHGTLRKCSVGDSILSNFCDDASCSVCNIMRTSFRVARAGQRFGFRRFGAGIYTTATSSKANDYVVEAGGSGFRAMILSEVVLGRVSKMTKGDGTLTAPPAGYDSVVGEPGVELNYDEVVVYKNEAIRPLFLVIYKP